MARKCVYGTKKQCRKTRKKRCKHGVSKATGKCLKKKRTHPLLRGRSAHRAMRSGRVAMRRLPARQPYGLLPAQGSVFY